MWLGQFDDFTALIERDLRQQCDLRLDEYRILSLVENGPLVQKVLACDMRRSFSPVSRWVTVLSHLGLVTSCSERGVRGYKVIITRRGRHHLKRARGYLSERYGMLADELSDSDLDLLQRVENNMRRFVNLGNRLS